MSRIAFLITEILRDGAVLGRIVTMETSGEDFHELLNQLGKVRKPEELEAPLHRVLYDLINSATGLGYSLTLDSGQRSALQ